MQVHPIFDKYSNTYTYVISKGSDAIVIDPVLTFNPSTSEVSYEGIEQIIEYCEFNKLTLHSSIETHVHADHLSGGFELKQRLPHLKSAISSKITAVQEIFSNVFNFENFPCDGSQFDILLNDGEILEFGEINVKVIATPGHTPACTSFLIEDCVFTGDALFMPDFGTGRCDFPAGSAKDLYHSIHETLYALPDETEVFVGHDYGPGGRERQYQTTIGECKKNSIQVKSETTAEEFIKFRTERDAKLSPPKLLMHSLQVNIKAGELPKPESNGKRYFKFPINL